VAKKARSRQRPGAGGDGVGPRQPCPCGSGRRYKACHGSAAGPAAHVVRTFQDLPGECDWVALREFVPAATANLQLRADAYDGRADGRNVTVTTVLPGIAPALVRADGEIRFAVQVAHQSADLSRDYAEALRLALLGAPGDSVVLADLPTGPGARLQDVVDPAATFTVTVLDGFNFWFDEAERADPSVAATLENLNASVDPTSRLESVEAAYWTSVGTREHLRWVQRLDEELLLSALARLHVAGADGLVPQSRLVGSFRAHGLLVPVWDLPVGTGAAALEAPAVAFAARLADAMADTSPLTNEQRSARSGLANRQVTIR
jgi:hypothetical protein